jgi:predicted DNA-binding protein (MmcQ/YjbR family)
MAEVKAARQRLRAHALKHPGAWEDHPWGEDVAKVGKKIFVFFGLDGPELMVGVKLPRSLLFARTQKFVGKVGYGMDRSGWVASRFGKDDDIPLELLRDWIDESYEAVAAGALPKRTMAKPPPRRRASAKPPGRRPARPTKRT